MPQCSMYVIVDPCCNRNVGQDNLYLEKKPQAAIISYSYIDILIV